MVIAVGCCGQTMAQGGVKAFIKKVEAKMDSMAVKGVDRRYIDAPERPWQVIVRGNVSQTIVSMNTQGSMVGMDYTVNVGGDKGSLLTFGATGSAYGINVRIHSFQNSNPSFNLNSDLLTEEVQDTWNDLQLTDPIRVRTVIADGYYMFNGKKFSYAAAYDQSVIQKRSAGSLMAGLMYNYTNNIRYSHNNTHGYLNDWFVNTSIGIRL